MGKIVASYLVKAHLHAPDDEESIATVEQEIPTDEVVKAAVIAGLEKELGGQITVSLIERTDSD